MNSDFSLIGDGEKPHNKQSNAPYPTANEEMRTKVN